MKNLGLLLMLFAFIGFSFTNPIDTKSVDTAKSQVIWKGYKVTGEHEGTIAIKKGNLEFDNGALSGGTFVIDMPTIKVTDLSGGMATKLEGHLKSPDFFGVEKFPEATFKITKVVSRGTPGAYKVVGDLTIKEITKEIKFDANLAADGSTATAAIKIDRSDFDVRYGSGSFFDNLGDKTIYDEFDLNVTIAVK